MSNPNSTPKPKIYKKNWVSCQNLKPANTDKNKNVGITIKKKKKSKPLVTKVKKNIRQTGCIAQIRCGQ
jgi:hypothetical protein